MLAEKQAALSPDFHEALSLYSGLQGWDNAPLAADAKAVAELQLLASSHVVDLEAITSVVRNDLGLTLHLLQLTARERGKHAGTMSTLSEVIVQLGLEQLRNIAGEVTLTCRTQRDS